MRILSTDTFREIVELYASTQDLCGCIVMRNAERRRDLYREITKYNMRDECNLVRHGNVLSFRNRSRIHLCILANRPKCMYDDVLFDETIDDLEALYHFDRLEYSKEPTDLDPIEPSTEILEYIGGTQ